MIQAALQPQLKLNDPRYRRPMMSVDAVKGALDRSEDEVLLLLADGFLVGWNIATPDAQRRELRILTRSVSAALSDPVTPTKWIWSFILDLVLPEHHKPIFTGIEIQRALNCSSTHVVNLVEAGLVKLLPGSTYRPGRGGSPLIERGGFANLLRERLEIATHIRGVFRS